MQLLFFGLGIFCQGGGDITEDDNSYYGDFITEYYGILRILRKFITDITDILAAKYGIYFLTLPFQPMQIRPAQATTVAKACTEHVCTSSNASNASGTAKPIPKKTVCGLSMAGGAF